MTRSSRAPRARSSSMTRRLTSCEKASPFTVWSVRPSAFARRCASARLYQPALPVFSPWGGRSRQTPIVSAPEPKLAQSTLASP